MSELSGIRALCFDVFGTVVDWREGVARDVAAALPHLDARAFADHWRAGYQPAMEAVRSGARPWVTLDTLHREIATELLARHGVEDAPQALADELTLAWHRLDPWPEVVEGLARLRTKYILAVLSNANIALMVDLCRRSGMVFDCILGGETARSFKPMPQVYQNAAKVLGLRMDQVLMVAAHAYDLDAASALGMKTCFVHRPLEHGPGTARPKPADDRFDIVVEGFDELAGRLGC